MRCPKCYNQETKVYDTRSTKGGKITKRRRECESCAYRFTTIEEIKVGDIKVQKRNGSTQDFDQEKLEQGIRKAFNKRTIDNNKVAQVVQKVTEDVMALNKPVVKSTRIGKMVLKHLRQIDEAAYITFAAMFWNVDSIEVFQDLLKEFKKD
jgi:transcriptional repressor NrdR